MPVDGVAGRLGIFYEDQHGPRRNAGSETGIYDAGVSFDLALADLVLQATRYEQKLGGSRLRGIPTDNFGNFLAECRWNHNEASDFLDLESNVVQARLTAEPVAGLTLDAGLRYTDGTEEQNYHEPNGLVDSDGDGVIDSSRLQFRDQYRRNESVTAGTNAIWSVSYGQFENRVLAGADWFRLGADFTGVLVNGVNTVVAGQPTPLSLLSPVYGTTDPSTYVRPAPSVTESRQTRSGLYTLNELTWGPVIAVAGLRQDTFEDVNLINGQTFEDDAVTWRAGLVYRVRPDVSLFGQWATSLAARYRRADPTCRRPFRADRR